MEKVVVKKVPLMVQELKKKLRQVISSELKKDADVQIFIEKSLYDEIKYNYFDFNMEPTSSESSGHYAKYMENAYELQNARGGNEGLIEFVSNCNGFMQVTRFKWELEDYVHYNCGMKKILIICKYVRETEQ